MIDFVFLQGNNVLARRAAGGMYTYWSNMFIPFSREVLYMVILSFLEQLCQLATLSSSTATMCKCIHSLETV